MRIDASRMKLIHDSKSKTVFKAESGLDICINKVVRKKNQNHQQNNWKAQKNRMPKK